MRGPKSKIKIDKTKLKFKEMIKISRSLKTAHSMVVRVTIILLLSIGLSITETSRKTNSTRNTVKKWAVRFNELGLDGLNDKQRSGCPKKFSPEVAIHIIKIACEMPELRNRSLDKWDCTEIANELIRTNVVNEISQETIRKILKNQKLKPWKHHMWLSEKEKSPRDQLFCNKIKDIIEVYFRKLEDWNVF